MTAGERGFQFGGRLSLDLTWTVRYRSIAPMELLTGPDDLASWCSLLFHDSSRPGRRRWCSTSRCGSRVNTQAHRRRRREGSTDPERTHRAVDD